MYSEAKRQSNECNQSKLLQIITYFIETEWKNRSLQGLRQTSNTAQQHNIGGRDFKHIYLTKAGHHFENTSATIPPTDICQGSVWQNQNRAG
jgi:hypothetical protein